MANSATTTRLCGALAAAMGGFYVLEGLGVIGGAAPASGDERAVAACAGAMFVAGGAAAVLTTIPGRGVRAAIEALSLAIVSGFAAIAGWISIGPGERHFGGSLAMFGARANEIGGRVMFGVSALVCLAIAMAMANAVSRQLGWTAGKRR